MAIVIRGKSTCVICGKILQEGQELVCFSPFVWNELDPLWKFSDAAVHETCFREDALAEKAQKRYDELESHIFPRNRLCGVCKQEITHPDDYFSLGHLRESPEDILSAYNYTQAHRSCFPRWSELSQVLDLLKALKASETWRGQYLDHWISELEEACRRVARR
jgi:hypothetical protein